MHTFIILFLTQLHVFLSSFRELITWNSSVITVEEQQKKHIATATREFPSVEITQREYSPCFSIMLRDRLGTRSYIFSSASESAQRAKLFSASKEQTSSRRRPRVRESEEIRVRISFIACLDKILAANRWIHLKTSLCFPHESFFALQGELDSRWRGGGVRGWRRWAIERKKVRLFIYMYISRGYYDIVMRSFARSSYRSIRVMTMTTMTAKRAWTEEVGARDFSPLSPPRRRRREREQSCEFVAFDSLIFSRREKKFSVLFEPFSY